MRTGLWIKRTLSAAMGLGVLLTAHTHAAPAARPDRVVFTSNRAGELQFRIYTMNADGTGAKRLTTGDNMEVDPAWSPDGKRVAFAATSGPLMPKSAIYVINADGTDLKRLTPDNAMAIAPAWSPDGKRVAYSLFDPHGGPMNVWIVGADGKGARRVGEGGFPQWSPDGKQILNTRVSAVGFRMYVMDADGKNAKPLLGNREAMLGAWSPDGKQIALTAKREDDQTEIFVADADGSNLRAVTKTADHEIAPVWSPDGKRIYFSRMPKDLDGLKGEINLFAIDLDGKNERQLTRGAGGNMLGGTLLLAISMPEPG